MLIVVLSLGAWDRARQFTSPQVVAWWRFEDGDPGHWLDARLGSARAPYTVTVDSSGNGNSLRTFNTRPTFYPPDTSPEFSDEVAADTVAEQPNHRSIHLNGKQYLYTVGPSVDPAIGAGFTIEGMFRLAVLPGDYDGKTQVILCKINATTSAQPTTKLSTELTGSLSTRPTTQRLALPGTQPSTQPDNGPTSRPSSKPATTATTQTTRPTTRLEEEPVATELPSDHPLQPVVCLVAGSNSEATRVNHFEVSLLDRNKKTHVLSSQNSLYARQWYAFAVVSDGVNAHLYLSDLSDGRYQLQESTRIDPGLMGGKGIWNIGCGLIDDLQDRWFQGHIDEIRISTGMWDPAHFVASGVVRKQPQARQLTAGEQSTPQPIVKGLADPSVMIFQGTYYLYGTRDQGGFPVYTSTDLRQWIHGPIVFNKTRRMWGESRFWAPSVISYKNRFYLFYSALGPLHDSGNRHSHRVCIAGGRQTRGAVRGLCFTIAIKWESRHRPRSVC